MRHHRVQIARDAHHNTSKKLSELQHAGVFIRIGVNATKMSDKWSLRDSKKADELVADWSIPRRQNARQETI
eukprot:3477459-Amphidinium_carterae.1